MMKAQTILTFFLIKQFYCYVYDEKYPIILSTSQGLSELQGVTLDTDHFGFNLDLDAGSKHLWVGAPKGASPSNNNEVPGTLHTCDLNMRNPGSCKILPDTAVSGNEDVNGQLYGISVNTVNSKAKGTTEVWSCATNFKRPYKDPVSTITKTYAMMLGHCYAYTNPSSNPRRVIPLDDKSTQDSRDEQMNGRDGWENNRNAFRYGNLYAELGSSFHFDTTGDKILFGAPGTWNWTGTTIITDSNGNNPVRTQPRTKLQPWMYDYTAYALTSGNFGYFAEVNQRQYAVGSPRGTSDTYAEGNELRRTGQVYITQTKETNDFEYIQTLTPRGPQPFEYFGASLASVDLDGDGADELVVGSPLYSSHNVVQQSSSSTNYEEGRISIYTKRAHSRGTIRSCQCQQCTSCLQFSFSINGEMVKGRFGSAIASVGDLDGDGNEDLVVGSPYENNGQGAVRVFYGNNNLNKISDDLQIITPAKMNNNFRGFGISFSTNPHVDVDSNGLEDLAIGSHLSRNAVVLRRRPSVWVKLEINSDTDSINISDLKAFNLQICTTMYSDNSMSKNSGKLPTLDAAITLSNKFDDRTKKRTYFVDEYGEKKQMIEKDVKNLIPNVAKCIGGIKVEFRDDFTSADFDEAPLVFEAHLEAADPTNQKNEFNGQLGVLDPRKAGSQNQTKAIPFVSGCDGICSIDLAIDVQAKDISTTGFVIGSKDKMTVVFTIINRGKDLAFLPIIGIPVIPYLPIRQTGVVQCEPLGGLDDILNCQIGRPLKSMESYKVSIEYDVRKIPAATPRLFWRDVYVQSNSEGSNDIDRTNDKMSFEVPLITEADLQITGNNIENRMGYIENEVYLNKSFQHIYQVSKSLSTPITGVSLEVKVPMYFESTEFTRISSIEPLVGCKVKEPKVPRTTQASTFPQNINCNVPGIYCATISCPPFDLPKTDTAVKLQIEAEFLSSVVKRFTLIENTVEGENGIKLDEGEVRITSGARAKFSEDVQEVVSPDLNKLPDTANCYTIFVPEKIRQAFIWWQIVVAAFGALLLLLVFVILLVYCNCFKKKPRAEAEDGASELLQMGQVQQEEDETFLSAKSNIID